MLREPNQTLHLSRLALRGFEGIRSPQSPQQVSLGVTLRLGQAVPPRSHMKPLTSSEVVARIIDLNEGLRAFWTAADGWAPVSAAGLLSKSRLDRQVELSRTLKLWVSSGPGTSYKDGGLILAWANLGALVEGSLKLFLSVYYEDYKSDVDAIRKKGNLQDPDGLSLQPIRQFFLKKRLLSSKWLRWILFVQQRRNAIHAFRHTQIDDFAVFEKQTRQYLKLLSVINARLPYPDENRRSGRVLSG